MVYIYTVMHLQMMMKWLSEINHTLRMLQGRSPVRGGGLIWKMQTDTRRVMDLDVYKDGELNRF